MSEAELIHAACRGDGVAFGAVVAAYQNPIYNLYAPVHSGNVEV
jgi:hypothetical protein